MQDFPIECQINQGTMFPILPVRCACGRRIGCFQREIENKIGVNLNNLSHIESRNERLAQARVMAFTDMGFVKSCCLLMLTTYPFLAVNDIEGDGAYTDLSSADGNKKGERNNYLSYGSVGVPAQFCPKTRGQLGFDMNRYCSQLNAVVNEDIWEDNSEIYNNGTFPRFPFLAPSVTKPGPKLDTSHIEPPTFN